MVPLSAGTFTINESASSCPMTGYYSNAIGQLTEYLKGKFAD